jgi:hypothetical protein
MSHFGYLPDPIIPWKSISAIYIASVASQIPAVDNLPAIRLWYDEVHCGYLKEYESEIFKVCRMARKRTVLLQSGDETTGETPKVWCLNT